MLNYDTILQIVSVYKKCRQIDKDWSKNIKANFASRKGEIMLGAIIGDVVGSRFEWHNIHTKKFDFLPNSCFFTDDSVMTIAIAQAILSWQDDGFFSKANYPMLSSYAVKFMRKWGAKYPKAGYGGHFREWLRDANMGPYNSCGNGSAMRVSPVGWAARSLDECIAMSRAVTEVTHNHSDGIMGSEATAVQIFQALHGMSLEQLRDYEKTHYYALEHNLKWLRENYTWQSLCNGTCQPAFVCVYESKNFEDAIRNCMSIGGDCDTTGAICGSIAEAVWGIPQKHAQRVMDFMDDEQKQIVLEFQSRFGKKLC